MPHHHYIKEVFVFAPLSDGIVHALKIHAILFFCIQFKDYIQPQMKVLVLMRLRKLITTRFLISKLSL